MTPLGKMAATHQAGLPAQDLDWHQLEAANCTLTVSMAPARCRVSHTRTVPSQPAEANTQASAGAQWMSSTEPS